MLLPFEFLVTFLITFFAQLCALVALPLSPGIEGSAHGIRTLRTLRRRRRTKRRSDDDDDESKQST